MILFLIILLSSSGICGAFTPKDHYLLNCGPSSNSAAVTFDDRVWLNDHNATFAPLSSFSSTVAVLANPDPRSPFKGARIFKSNFTYSFPVPHGPIFLRLYFYPTLYSGPYDASQFFISVQANNHVLLRNFSAQLALNYAPFTAWPNTSTNKYVMKEYYIAVGSNESSLDLTFSPTPPSSYAFVNGIEVVSLPESLYVTGNTIENVESSNQYQISSSAALETVYRLNVGGSDVVDNDNGMYRIWKTDDPYTYLLYGQNGITQDQIKYTEQVPNYTAPEPVYKTFRELNYGGDENQKLNLTWRFDVDPGFSYMVRLHWCEVDIHMNKTGDRIFEVYINSFTAERDMDVLFITGNQRDVPYYKDYVVPVPEGDGGGSSEVIWIALHPNTTLHPVYTEVLLNGLEIFKINKPDDGSLYAPNPQVPLDAPSQEAPITEPPKRSHLLVAKIGGIVAGMLLLVTLLTCVIIFRRTKAKKESESKFGTGASSSTWFIPSFKSVSKTTASERGSTLPSHLCRRFSIAQMRLATNDFSEGLIIGHGGFGNVYKGMVDGEKGSLAVAIKRLNASSKQGVREFVTEIDLLSKLRHVHLVSLIGFCDERGEMILVYEYMERGTLRDHLYNTVDKPPLSWNERLNACLGAAKGLHYLHCGASQMIIHRDVKSTNILIDEKWVSKVSDFGLSKLGPVGADLSHVSTAVKGSIGYLDLEYYKTQRLTEKSDVYSFGVVLFEVLCGRAAVDVSLSKEQVNLAKWARSHQRKGTLDMIVDPNIRDEITPACLRKFGEIAERCVKDHGSDRPSMADVVWCLEFVIELQERPDNDMSNGNSVIYPSLIVTANTTNNDSNTATANDGFHFSTTSGEHMTRTDSSSALVSSVSKDYGESTSMTVFSEIIKPLGR